MPPAGPCIAVSSVTEVGHTGILADPDDSADTADADAFETLNQTSSPTSVAPESSGLQSSMPLLDDTIESGTYNAEASSNTFVDHFPHGHPGAPLSMEQVSIFESVQNSLGGSIWAPFQSQVDWEIARWAKMCGPSSTALTELLAIPEVREDVPKLLYCVTNILWKVVEKLSLSYSTSKELNDIIDKALPGPPPFQCLNLNVDGEDLEFHCREIIPCIRSLFGNPDFANELIYAPERHYTDAERTCRVYNEMHTGNWWWSVQVCASLNFDIKCLFEITRVPSRRAVPVPLSSPSLFPPTKLS